MSKVVMGVNSQLNGKQVAGVIELYTKFKFKIHTIARLYGIADTTVKRILNRNGYYQTKRFSMTDNQRKFAGILYKQGFVLKDIGRMFKKSRWTIKTALHLEGIKTRAEELQQS